MRFSDVQTFLTDGLTGLGYGTLPSILPTILPGPNTDPALQMTSPDRLVFATVGGGLGLDSEELFDRLFLTIRVIGNQNDYVSAESLAWDLDTMLLKINGNATLGTAKVLYVVRAGGGPSLIQKDAADRYHFQCTYVTSTQTGL